MKILVSPEGESQEPAKAEALRPVIIPPLDGTNTETHLTDTLCSLQHPTTRATVK